MVFAGHITLLHDETGRHTARCPSDLHLWWEGHVTPVQLTTQRAFLLETMQSNPIGQVIWSHDVAGRQRTFVRERYAISVHTSSA